MNLLLKYIIAVGSAALVSGISSYLFHEVIFKNVYFPSDLSSLYIPLEQRSLGIFIVSMLSFSWGMEWAMSL